MSGVATNTRRAITAALTARGRALEDEAADGPPAVARALGLLSELDDALDDVELEESGFDAVGPGVVRTCRRGRDALGVAIDAVAAQHR